jgi:phosphoenolpyruvate carboxykinase (GTP)
MIFGARRADTIPVVVEAESGEDGVYKAATMGSETTAAIVGEVGVVRRDPMAMLPFCGYHVGDYFEHWLAIGKSAAKPPRIFNVNWFRKGADGKFIWPGFGENMRVLKWIVERCEGTAGGVETPLGVAPRFADLHWQGLSFPEAKFNEAMRIDGSTWNQELTSHDQLFDKVGEKLPTALRERRQTLEEQFRH